MVRKISPGWLALLFITAFGCSEVVTAQATPTLSLEQRLAHMERLVNSAALMELLQRVERLQREIQELRGEGELQSHALQELKGQQRELYLDVDRRLRRLETASGAGSPGQDTGGTAAPATTPTEPARAPAEGVPTDTAQDQAAYQEAVNLLKEGRYEQAIAALNGLLQQSPQGTYADNAQYWLGEAYYVTRQYEAALQAFQKLLQAYPQSRKVSHAELKLGYIYYELGQMEKARSLLEGLVSRYPESAVGRLAEERLERMRSEQR